MRLGYTPWDSDVIVDPYPYYGRLRADGGCHELADLDMWVLSTYELVSQALRDHRTFTSVGGVSRERSAETGGWISADPPSHTTTRGLAAPVFRRAAMARHEPAIRATTAETVERFVSAGGGEVVSEVAEPVAVASLCALLGVPNDWPREMVAMSERGFVDISAWSADDRAADSDRLAYAVGIPISKLIESQLDREVPDPAATMLDMITAHAGEDAGFTLDAFGRASYLTTLVTPGVETTRSMITAAVALAAEHPEEWAAVRAGDVSAGDFIAEVLRFESPIQGFFRCTTRAVDMGGTTIPEGARVLCLYGSANRDEAVFEQADLFRPGRPNARRHLAYGAGIHRCIGATLAEAEGVAAIEALATAVERFEVIDAVRRDDMAQLRNFARLEVSAA